MGNKQDELKMCMQSQGFDLTVVTETWWDCSCDCNVGMKGYALFKRAALTVSNFVLVRMMGLWIRIKQQTSEGVCCCGCLLPDHQEKVNAAIYRHLKQPQSHKPWLFWGTLLP